MLTSHRSLWILLLGAVLALGTAACGDDGDGDDGDGSVEGMDGSSGSDGSAGADGATGSDGSTGMDGGTPTDGGGTGFDAAGWGMYPDGGCAPILCEGLGPYKCANCIDDDEDGFTDAFDPDCLGPCDNNEEGFDLLIPGGDTPSCARDCYFDKDQGRGNDDCNWDSRCDPLSPDSRAACSYNPDAPSAACDDELTSMCLDYCPPLVPNGCDCFGCCNIKERHEDPDNWVFIGTLDSAGDGTCTLERALAEDEDACHPCTPHGDCSNECARCELCLGKTTLPADCFDTPPPDAGTLPDGGTPPEPDGGTPSDRCPGGEQPCGLPGDPLCADGYYCLTGCCVFFG